VPPDARRVRTGAVGVMPAIHRKFHADQTQNFRNQDGTIRLLIIFQNSNQGSWHTQTGAI